MNHGCRSDKWIFEGEAKAEIEELGKMWRAQFPLLPATMERVLERLIRADFRVQWTELKVFEMESALENTPGNEWTAEQQNKLQLFYRYHTTAERQFHRHLNLLKEYGTTASKPVEQKAQQEEEEEPMKSEPVGEETPLFQMVVVTISDGKTVTRMHPTNEQRMSGGGLDSSTQRAVRRFEFPDGVPEEYYWVFPNEQKRRAGAKYELKMSVQKWAELAHRELVNGTGHAEPMEFEVKS